jgi:signal peptidase I
VLVIAGCVFLLRATALDWNVVPTGSMRPTILEGDYLLVNKYAYDARVPCFGWKLAASSDPQRGDIVVLEPPGHSERFVKRVLGLPGETVQVRNHRLYINGIAAGYDFPIQPDIPRLADADSWPPELLIARLNAAPLTALHQAETTYGPRTVPLGEYFVLGDNRGNSKDSRSFGFVPRDRIIGRAVRVLISLDPSRGGLPRFDRFFRPLT